MGIEHFKYAFGTGGGFIEHIVYRRQLEEGLVDMAEIDDKDEEISDAEYALAGKGAPTPYCQYDSQASGPFEESCGNQRGGVGLDHAVAETEAAFFDLAGGVFLAHEGLDDRDTGYIVLDLGDEFGKVAAYIAPHNANFGYVAVD